MPAPNLLLSFFRRSSFAVVAAALAGVAWTSALSPGSDDGVVLGSDSESDKNSGLRPKALPQIDTHMLGVTNRVEVMFVSGSGRGAAGRV